MGVSFGMGGSQKDQTGNTSNYFLGDDPTHQWSPSLDLVYRMAEMANQSGAQSNLLFGGEGYGGSFESAEQRAAREAGWNHNAKPYGGWGGYGSGNPAQMWDPATGSYANGYSPNNSYYGGSPASQPPKISDGGQLTSVPPAPPKPGTPGGVPLPGQPGGPATGPAKPPKKAPWDPGGGYTIDSDNPYFKAAASAGGANPGPTDRVSAVYSLLQGAGVPTDHLNAENVREALGRGIDPNTLANHYYDQVKSYSKGASPQQLSEGAYKAWTLTHSNGMLDNDAYDRLANAGPSAFNAPSQALATREEMNAYHGNSTASPFMPNGIPQNTDPAKAAAARSEWMAAKRGEAKPGPQTTATPPPATGAVPPRTATPTTGNRAGVNLDGGMSSMMATAPGGSYGNNEEGDGSTDGENLPTKEPSNPTTTPPPRRKLPPNNPWPTGGPGGTYGGGGTTPMPGYGGAGGRDDGGATDGSTEPTGPRGPVNQDNNPNGPGGGGTQGEAGYPYPIWGNYPLDGSGKPVDFYFQQGSNDGMTPDAWSTSAPWRPTTPTGGLYGAYSELAGGTLTPYENQIGDAWRGRAIDPVGWADQDYMNQLGEYQHSPGKGIDEAYNAYNSMINSQGYSPQEKAAIEASAVKGANLGYQRSSDDIKRQAARTGNSNSAYAALASMGTNYGAGLGDMNRENQIRFADETQKRHETGASGMTNVAALANSKAQFGLNQGSQFANELARRQETAIRGMGDYASFGRGLQQQGLAGLNDLYKQQQGQTQNWYNQIANLLGRQVGTRMYGESSGVGVNGGVTGGS